MARRTGCRSGWRAVISLLTSSPARRASSSPGPTRGRPRVFVSHGKADQILPIESTSRRIVPGPRKGRLCGDLSRVRRPAHSPAGHRSRGTHVVQRRETARTITADHHERQRPPPRVTDNADSINDTGCHSHSALLPCSPRRARRRRLPAIDDNDRPQDRRQRHDRAGDCRVGAGHWNAAGHGRRQSDRREIAAALRRGTGAQGRRDDGRDVRLGRAHQERRARGLSRALLVRRHLEGDRQDGSGDGQPRAQRRHQEAAVRFAFSNGRDRLDAHDSDARADARRRWPAAARRRNAMPTRHRRRRR